MELTSYIETLRRDLAVAAEAGGEDARALAERLTAPLEASIRLMLLDALSAAADDITRELAPGSGELRPRGGGAARGWSCGCAAGSPSRGSGPRGPRSRRPPSRPLLPRRRTVPWRGS